MSSPGRAAAVQPALWTPDAEPPTPLREVTFVVVDLETTGGSPADSEILEVGAVKVRGGEVLGEFQTLVRPATSIPAFICVLTGITDRLVAAAPPVSAVLPGFLEFAAGCVLVAHNAPFDIGFLRAGCERLDLPWPDPPVLDTVRLARQLVDRDEAPDRRLGTLARLFGASVTPDHRALSDARATVDVLHALIGRVGSQGVHTLEELLRYSAQVPARVRRKRQLADGLPGGPGVYLFHDADGRVLYVGTSGDLRARVLSYFTQAERRPRMARMVGLAERVSAVPCATPLEAGVRELRLIAEHAPPFNRRSRFPERSPWVKLSAEPYPRLLVTRQVVEDGGTYLGPFLSAGQAKLAVEALQEAFAVRRCGGRLPRVPRPDAGACALAELGRCPAPCVPGDGTQAYAAVAEQVRLAITAGAGPVVAAALERSTRLANQERFEEAAVHRDRLTAYLRGAARRQRLAPLAAAAQLVAARRRERGGWELVVSRHGRLAGTTLSPPGADPRPYVSAMLETAEVVLPVPAPAPAAHPEETDLLLRWLEQPGVRLVELDGVWSCPVDGAEGAVARLPGTPRAGGQRPGTAA